MSRILIIEDEENLANFVELELKHEGYDTDVELDGRAGLEAALIQRSHQLPLVCEIGVA